MARGRGLFCFFLSDFGLIFRMVSWGISHVQGELSRCDIAKICLLEGTLLLMVNLDILWRHSMVVISCL